MYWDTDTLYGWATSQKLPGDGFEWVDRIAFNKDFIKKLQ